MQPKNSNSLKKFDKKLTTHIAYYKPSCNGKVNVFFLEKIYAALRWFAKLSSSGIFVKRGRNRKKEGVRRRSADSSVHLSEKAGETGEKARFNLKQRVFCDIIQFNMILIHKEAHHGARV